MAKTQCESFAINKLSQLVHSTQKHIMKEAIEISVPRIAVAMVAQNLQNGQLSENMRMLELGDGDAAEPMPCDLIIYWNHQRDLVGDANKWLQQIWNDSNVALDCFIPADYQLTAEFDKLRLSNPEWTESRGLNDVSKDSLWSLLSQIKNLELENRALIEQNQTERVSVAADSVVEPAGLVQVQHILHQSFLVILVLKFANFSGRRFGNEPQ